MTCIFALMISLFLDTSFNVNVEPPILLNVPSSPITIALPNVTNQIPKDTLQRVDSILVVDYNQLEPYLFTKSKTVHIVNFWAMWCAPCVKELPHLVAYAKNNPEVELLLVSLDFPESIESQLIPFLKKRGISAKVLVLNDSDANYWIDKINPSWSGSIPFTIIFNNENRSYHEIEFESTDDIQKVINNTIK